MSVTAAIADLSAAILNLSWVTSVHEVDRDPGGNYSVYLLPAGVGVVRNITSIKRHLYAFKLKLSIGGNNATAANIYTKMSELEEAVELDQHRDGNAMTTFIGEEWELTETEEAINGFVSFEVPVFMEINN
jgi:hypothetical protein